MKLKIKGSKRIDALSLSGILLMFINQKESHLYYIIENLKKAQSILDSKYDLDDICSLDSKVIQKTETVTDMVGIRNAVCHSSFNLDFREDELWIDFRGTMSDYNMDKQYRSRDLALMYKNYDKLIGIQECFMRVAFLISILLIAFQRAQSDI